MLNVDEERMNNHFANFGGNRLGDTGFQDKKLICQSEVRPL